MEIQFLEQRMLQILGQEINQLQKKIEFLSRHQTDKGVGDLSLGDRDPRVRSLQVFLNQNGFPLAAAGPGSDGERDRLLRSSDPSISPPVSGSSGHSGDRHG